MPPGPGHKSAISHFNEMGRKYYMWLAPWLPEMKAKFFAEQDTAQPVTGRGGHGGAWVWAKGSGSHSLAFFKVGPPVIEPT